MFIIHLALGGCLGAPPVRFGITSDTGGHIAYVLGAAMAQATLASVRKVSIVTRLFHESKLSHEFSIPEQEVATKLTINRVATSKRCYLEKEALTAELPALTLAFLDHLAGLAELPDVIHAHFADAASIAENARNRFGIPFVYTPHALGIDKRSEMLADRALLARISLERNAIKSADAIIVSTQDEANRQIAAYGVSDAATRIACILPGVSRDVIRTTRTSGVISLEQLFDDPEKPIILAIARPVRKKNLAAIVRAFAATDGLAHKANLMIIAGQHGIGLRSMEEREVLRELERLCNAERLRGRVALPPRHDAEDVSRLYYKAAMGGVFVNAALHEPFGLTLVEAAAMGVPVVATRHGGPVDIIGATGHGLLVDPHDDAAIGAACMRILSTPRLHAQLSKSGRDRAPMFSWSNYAKLSVSRYASLKRARLFASDIDNTLTGCRVGAEVFSGWRSSCQMPFVVATGRSIEAARAVMTEWGLPQPDAYIVDVGTRIILPIAGGGWRECSSYATLIDRDWNRCAVAKVIARLVITRQPQNTDGPHKLSFYGTYADVATIEAALDNAGLRANVVFSHGCLIDVLPPYAGKAAALTAYVSAIGLSLDDCIAAGDSGNDLDMLTVSGRAIIVGNATTELSSLAPREGLLRVAGHFATGVMEGLVAFGAAQSIRHMVCA